MATKLNLRITTSWDDGDPADIRLIDLLAKYKIRGTIYFSPNNRERPILDKSFIKYINGNIEIGSHSLTHPPDLCRLDDRQLKREIYDSKLALEDITGRSIEVFCYPRGKYNCRVREMVRKAGYIGARSSRQFFLSPGAQALRMLTTIFVDPLPRRIRLRHEFLSRDFHSLGVYLKRGIFRSWKELAIDFLELARESGGTWHLWGHSWEISIFNLWDDLDFLFSKISGLNDVAYLTNSEVIKSRNRSGL